jgi:flavoprotein
MADILPFKRPRPADKHKGKTLCRSGFHQWEICPEKPFDSKQGRLVTLYRCKRCGATKTQAQ